MNSLGNDPTFKRTLTRIILLPIGLLMVLVLVFLAQLQSLLSAVQWVDHTDQVVSQTREVQILLLNEQASLRGYLLTGDQDLLQPYAQSSRAVDSKLNVLSTTVADNPPQVDRAASLRADNAAWLGIAQNMIEVRSQNGDFQSLLRQGRGAALMNNMRATITTFIATEEALRNNRSSAVQRTTWIVVISSLVIVALLGALLSFLLHRQVTALAQRYETALATVQARTETLRIEREWFSGTLSSIGDAVIATDTNGQITFMNAVAQTLTGHTEQEARNKPLSDVFNIRNGSTHATIESPVNKVLRDGKIVGLANHTELVRPDHTTVPIDDSAAPIRDAQAALLGVVLVFRDITARKQTEHELRERTTILRAVTDSAADAIIVKDRQGTIMLANPTTLRTVGKSEAEILGKTTFDYLANPVEAARVVEHDRGVMEAGRSIIVEEVVALPHGTRIFLSTKSPFYDEHGVVVGVIGISTDITERKRAEDALRQSESQLRLALDAAKMGTWAWHQADDQTITDEYANRLLGVAPDARLHGLDIVYPDDRAHFQESAARTREDGVLQVEFRVLHPQTGLRWIEMNGRFVQDAVGQSNRMVGVIQDVTTRKTTDDQLRASEQRYRDLANSMPLIVWTARADGWIDYYNQRWFEYTGLPLEATQGTGWLDVIHPDDVQMSTERWQHAVQTGEPYELEYRWKRGFDSTYRWYLGRAQPTRDEQGQIVRWTGTGTDIDDQKQLEDQLRTQTDELVRATAQLEDRNRELDHFAYVTSHDLKAPLRGIANLSQWIEEDLGEQATDDIRKQLELMRGRVHRMEGLIEGILQYSRVGRAKLESEAVNTDELLHEIVDLLAPPAGVQIEIGPHMPTLRTEKVPLQQVFQNLISNALKHHHHPNNAQLWINVKDAGTFYEFSVRDDGPGIAPQYHDKIFVIFQTLASRDKVEGSGLGLSLVKKIVESHGGRIDVESEEGRGAVFTFTWPKQSKKGR